MFLNQASTKQLVVTPGFLGGKVLTDKHLAFWTLTMWNMDADMKLFRNSVPHVKAMRKLPNLCDEASYVHWTHDEPKLPSWALAEEKMRTDGKLTKVKRPSKDQLAGTFLPIQWHKLERTFKP